MLSNEKASFSHNRPQTLRRSAGPPRRTLFTALALLVILALALGLGLGLGLEHHTSITDSTSTFPHLQPTPSENFYLDGLRGQPPQTRTYSFVVSQVQGALDGVSKPMLVVNGRFAFCVCRVKLILPQACIPDQRSKRTKATGWS